MDSEGGCCCWSWHIWSLHLIFPPQVFSKKWSVFARHLVCASLANGFKKCGDRESHLLSFDVSCKSSLSCFDWLCCFSVSGKIRNDYWLFIKNAWHSLFYVAREISRQFYQMCAHFLLHEWPRSLLTLMEIDDLKKKKQKKNLHLQRSSLSATSVFIRIFMGSCVSLAGARAHCSESVLKATENDGVQLDSAANV